MTRRALLVSVFLAFLSALQLVMAQSGRRGFDVLSVEHGLSQAAVIAIAQDQLGYMWFGTQEGLSRYDGSQFETFLHDPYDLNSISNDWIWDLLVDDRGDIWIATLGGLNRFSYKTGQFKRYLNDPQEPGSIGGNDIRDLFQDSHGRIWIATESNGLSVWDRESDLFEHVRHNPEQANSLSSDKTRSIAQTSDGLLWVATDGGGLNRLDPDLLTTTRREIKLSSPADSVAKRLLSVIAPGDGTLWVATYENGVVRYDPIDRRSVQYAADPDNPESLISDSVRAMFIDARNEL